MTLATNQVNVCGNATLLASAAQKAQEQAYNLPGHLTSLLGLCSGMDSRQRNLGLKSQTHYKAQESCTRASVQKLALPVCFSHLHTRTMRGELKAL